MTMQVTLSVLKTTFEHDWPSDLRKLAADDWVTVVTDSRQVENAMVNGQWVLFVAIQGERFDGHDYVMGLLNQCDSVLVLVTQHWLQDQRLSADKKQRCIAVTNERNGLAQLAAAHFSWCNIPKRWVVNGSNGKTTAKTLLAQGFAQQTNTLVTQGNLNNDLGVPMTLLHARPDHQMAVIEIGANHVGEIGQLTPLVQPTGVIITNAMNAHLEGFGSFGNIQKAKGEALTHLVPGGLAILNRDDEAFCLWKQGLTPWPNTDGQQPTYISFGCHPEAHVRLLSVSLKRQGEHWVQQLFLVTPWTQWTQGQWQLNLPLLGKHNALNATGVIAALGAEGFNPQQIQASLDVAKSVPGRCHLQALSPWLWVLDDSYNANPQSMQAGLDTLLSMPGTKLACVGDYAELGDHTADFAQQLAQQLGEAAIQWVGFKTTNPDCIQAFVANAGHWSRSGYQTSSINDLVDVLWQTLQQAIDTQIIAPTAEQPVVLWVKGSRASRMEQVIEGMKGKINAMSSP